jgi:hypothetical protein
MFSGDDQMNITQIFNTQENRGQLSLMSEEKLAFFDATNFMELGSSGVDTSCATTQDLPRII